MLQFSILDCRCSIERFKNKIAFRLALAALLFLFSLTADAQEAGKIFRIGFLDSSTPSGGAVLVDAFRQELSKLGWTQGKNITIEYRFAEQKSERLAELATELVRLKVDLIVVASTGPALAAKSATATIPIVMASGGDPVGAGLVSSLARPRGNVTGNAGLSPQLILNGSRYSRTRSLGSPESDFCGQREVAQGIDLQLEEIRPAAVALKLKLEEIETQLDARGLERAFKTAKQKQVGAIMTTSSRPFFAERKPIVELAGKYQSPAIYSQKEFVDEGGLMSYGADFNDLYRRTARYVDKILKGAKPADLAVQQATKFEFVINLKAAKQIGLTIPNRVLERANQVIR